MSKTYVIADLHGRFDLLQMAFDKIIAQAKSGDTVVTLGDYVDRGPESRQIIECLMKDDQPSNIRLICLTGNHEDMMVQVCSNPTPKKLDWWMGNGGGATLISYGQEEGEIPNVSAVPAEHLKWLATLQTLHADKHRIYVHAGVDPSRPLHKQDREEMIWKIYDHKMGKGHGDKFVVHGHHHYDDGPRLWKGRLSLDTHAYSTGRLVVGVFDDDTPGGPVDSIEVQGPTLEEIFGARPKRAKVKSD